MASILPKMKPLIADPGTALLISNYEYTLKCNDPDRYLDPFRKKSELAELANKLDMAVRRIDEDSPSTDGVAELAAQISAVCSREDPLPEVPKTREQIYAELARDLDAYFCHSLIGKFLCLKEGPYTYTFIKVDRAEARVGIYKCLEMLVGGPGVKVCFDENVKGKVELPRFGKYSFGINDLVTEGKNQHLKRWLYQVEPGEIRAFYDRLYAVVGEYTGSVPENTEGN